MPARLRNRSGAGHRRPSRCPGSTRQPHPGLPSRSHLHCEQQGGGLGAATDHRHQRHPQAIAPIRQEILGSVSGVEVADLDANGLPEVYVFITSAGSGSYGSMEGWALNKGRRSLSTIHMPELTGQAAQGYQGHDEFAVVELTLARRFPIYRPGDNNAKPTGGTRQISYKLVPGEASWQLKPVRVDTY
ncbi:MULTISPECIES: hypothetical protein [Cyanobium]|uniref:Uncharacterized protein n=1 Tax=Cyanobium usitatum str. Tous TaxID=2116684 RepID=A0A2P7MVG6_9CYAN|nr:MULTISPECIES: hypothetical protein [Cyanobium]MCP9780612.1 hypothetical protein [Cyanobium sp. To12R1]PSJ05191.1 hypothetical protein C7K55_07595 [Cyanobium usitatum str. Tous]